MWRLPLCVVSNRVNSRQHRIASKEMAVSDRAVQIMDAAGHGALLEKFYINSDISPVMIIFLLAQPLHMFCLPFCGYMISLVHCTCALPGILFKPFLSAYWCQNYRFPSPAD